jgi:nitrite reductase/ring-hydroxylating ferredoxin subunit
VKQVICAADELKPGEMRAARLGPMPIVVIRTESGALHGLLDKCLHQGGQLSRGRLMPAMNGRTSGDYHEENGRVIVKCPWHGYEYDIATGCTLFDERRRLRIFNVREEAGQIVAET